MARVRHRVGINSSLSDVFVALTEPEGLTRWWSTTAAGSTNIGQTLELGFGGVITLAFVTRAKDANTRLLMSCPDGPGPWHESELEFTLEQDESQVFVTLMHHSAAASDDDFLYFNTKWPLYLLSLRDYLETGQGRPSPHDIPIYVGDSVTSNTE